MRGRFISLKWTTHSSLKITKLIYTGITVSTITSLLSIMDKILDPKQWNTGGCLTIGQQQLHIAHRTRSLLLCWLAQAVGTFFQGSVFLPMVNEQGTCQPRFWLAWELCKGGALTNGQRRHMLDTLRAHVRQHARRRGDSSFLTTGLPTMCTCWLSPKPQIRPSWNLDVFGFHLD